MDDNKTPTPPAPPQATQPPAAPVVDLAPLLRDLSARLSALIAGIRSRLGDGAAASPGPDLAQWPAVRERLEALLSDDDTAAVELFEANAALARAALGSRFDGFAGAIRKFDLPLALARLRAAP